MNADLQACREIERCTLDQITAAPGRPAALAPFDAFFRDRPRDVELRASKVPVVGQLCNFAPEELILAAGAVPLRLDSGCHPAVRRGEEHLPVDVCCAVRSAAGELLALPERPYRLDLLILADACDGKRKLAGLLADRYPVLVLELPREASGDAARTHWLAEVQRLVERLQALTGRKLSGRLLRQAVERLNRRTALLRQLNELRRGPLLPIRGIDAFLVMQASFTADPDWWSDRTAALVAELERRVQAGQGVRPRARLLLTGSPILWPDFKVLQGIQDAGAEVVADEMCSGTQRLHHPTVVDEDTRGGLIRAAAERTLLPCTCPTFASNDGRLDRLAELVEAYRIDGVIHHTLRLCQLYDIDSLRLSRWFRERHMPFLSLHAEFSPEESAVLKNRIDAFVEMIASA
jgi:benzoyl-CoA reductase/2-hydroxyglutaryl-CoA dehydratase subunit BcrC/BadD/HgdB